MANPDNDTGVNQTADKDEIDEIEKILNPASDKADKVDSSHDDDEDDGDDERTHVDKELESAETDDEREAIRARRRDDRKMRKTRQREKSASLERQVQALTKQNQQVIEQLASLQDNNTGAQLAQVDRAIQEADNAYQYHKNLVGDATTKGDGRAAAEATEAMIDARNRSKELMGLKQRATSAANAPKPLNQVMVSHASNFLGANKWYGGPQSSDQDSRVLSSIDNSLAAEGWDSTTPEYWTELNARGAKYLPHRFNGENTTVKQTIVYNGANTTPSVSGKNPVSGGNSGDGGSNKGGSVSFGLSAERVKAIKDAGAWDDSARRNKMITRYRDYDKSSNT